MIYFIPSVNLKHTYSEHFGSIVVPSKHPSGSGILFAKSGRLWICDNGAFKGNFHESIFFSFLKAMYEYRSNCVFAVAPDVFGDAKSTLLLYESFSERIRQSGYKVAFVAQDGQENLPLPSKFDALFIGGSTRWKLSSAADELISRAKQLGKWVHVGRVNSRKRVVHFALVGVDSVDGTHIIYKPDIHEEAITRWMQEKVLFQL